MLNSRHNSSHVTSQLHVKNVHLILFTESVIECAQYRPKETLHLGNVEY